MSNVCVVGLGKIGLPLACAIAHAGHSVIGADISQPLVDQVNAALEPFPGEVGLADALRGVVGSGALIATTDTVAAARASDVIVVVVPLIVDQDAKPDFRAMDAATAQIAEGVEPGSLVSYETTLPVGTTRNRFAPALAGGSELALGEELFVVHSPERVFSGRIFADLRRYPKLVGGIDDESSRRGVQFYESFLDFDDRPDLHRPNGVWNLDTAEAAEFAKLAETTYRDINIAYANELAVAAEGIGVDVYKVIDACNTQPFSHIHQPGISVGGHCIPVYPYFLTSSIEDPLRLPVAARSINGRMSERAIEKIELALGSLRSRRVAVLGLAYRPGVKEAAFSGAFSLTRMLAERGATALVHDPMYSTDEIEEYGLRSYRAGDGCDAVILHTAHPEYSSWTIREVPGVRVIYDGRNSRAVDVRVERLTLGRPVPPGTAGSNA